jgi:rfaE bifunctional protein kinase chain/domain
MLSALHRRVTSTGVTRAAGVETVIKTRILAGGIHSAKQQVVRIDRGVARPIDGRARARFEQAVLASLPDADAVLMSDYGSGLVTPALARRLSGALRKAGHPIPVLIDSRYGLLEYRGLTACTPNESEVEQALGVRINDNARTLESAGREILKRTAMQAVLITRGSRGMALFVPGAKTVHIPIHGSDEIADVTGAGDTVMATMTLALAAGATFESAARLANYAGGIVVMKRGTGHRVDEGTPRRRQLVSPKRWTEAEREGGWVRSSRAMPCWPGSPMHAALAGRWPLRTAALTCCTSATFATSPLLRRKPTS